MDFFSSTSHMIMQGFEPNGEIFPTFHLGNPNPSPNPNPDHWQQVDNFSICKPENYQSLSLSLSNPMNIAHHHHHHHHQEQFLMDDLGSERLDHLYQSQYQQPQAQQQFLLKRSKYLTATQELLSEFCNLGGTSNIHNTVVGSKNKKEDRSQWDEGGPSVNILYPMDPAELQKRKAKLLSMLEEVYRRYRRYSDQMRAVVSSFEATAGEGSATVYSTLASKAMSRHFRCLKDGIKTQIKATKMALGERDHATAPPGTTKGETPRLKKLEQCLRQHKAFHQGGIMESQSWRPQRGLPEHSVSVLRAWLFEHFLHPYPSDVDKHILSRQTGLSRSQVSNWFINARVRLWKPMVEEMYVEELKEEDKSNPNSKPDPSSSQLHAEEQKPSSGLLINDSDSLSSIINNNNSNPSPIPNPSTNFGILDFSSYNANGVSLTLGLQQQQQQQQEKAETNLTSFSPTSQQSFLYSRDHNINVDQSVQFSILGEEGQTLPYRNLMGAQLLNDLAG